MLRDAADGTLDHRWTCPSLRYAVKRLPHDPPSSSPVVPMLDAAAGAACDAAAAGIHTGESKPAVVAAFGRADRAGPRCSLYKWAPGGGATDALTVCFAAGRVARVETGVHG